MVSKSKCTHETDSSVNRKRPGWDCHYILGRKSESCWEHIATRNRYIVPFLAGWGLLASTDTEFDELSLALRKKLPKYPHFSESTSVDLPEPEIRILRILSWIITYYTYTFYWLYHSERRCFHRQADNSTIPFHHILNKMFPFISYSCKVLRSEIVFFLTRVSKYFDLYPG